MRYGVIKMDKHKKLKLTLIKSVIGRLENHKKCVIGLGLRRIGHSVIVENTQSNRGMIDKVSYLINVEEV